MKPSVCTAAFQPVPFVHLQYLQSCCALSRSPWQEHRRSESTACNCSLKNSAIAMGREPLAEVSPHAVNANSPEYHHTRQHGPSPHPSSFERGKSFDRDSQSSQGPHASDVQTPEQWLHTMERSAASHAPGSLSLRDAAAAQSASSLTSHTRNTWSLQRTSSLVLPAVRVTSKACASPVLAASAHRRSPEITTRSAGQHQLLSNNLRASCPMTLQGSPQQPGRLSAWPVQGQPRPTVQIPTPPNYGRYAAWSMAGTPTPLKPASACSPVSSASSSQVALFPTRLNAS